MKLHYRAGERMLRGFTAFLVALHISVIPVAAEPVLLKLSNPEPGTERSMQPYLKGLVNTIDRNWVSLDGAKQQATLEISFYLTPEGGVNHVEVTTPSGVPGVDDLAIRAIYEGSPYPRPPLVSEASIQLSAIFDSSTGTPSTQVNPSQTNGTRINRKGLENARIESLEMNTPAEIPVSDLPRLFLTNEASLEDCESQLKYWFSFPPEQRYGRADDLPPHIVPKSKHPLKTKRKARK